MELDKNLSYFNSHDYREGFMGVPISFLDEYCPAQFEILGMSASAGCNPSIVGIPRIKEYKDARPLINEKKYLCENFYPI